MRDARLHPALPQHSDAAVLLQELPAKSGMRIGVATLNVPKTLHALTLDMIIFLDGALQGWVADPGIACVVLQSSTDKAFCAGGDVRSLRSAILASPEQVPNPQAQAFFSAEYRLDYRIHTCPKPVLAWGNGIVMGGGLGLLAGASHRVVCETTRIAMPETAIGLFPDVGGSWFLPRMPGRIGLFLGLTGAAMNAHDALFAGLGDYAIRHQDRAAVLDALCGMNWGEVHDMATKPPSQQSPPDRHALLDRALQPFCIPAASLPASPLRLHGDMIGQLTASRSLPEVVSAIGAYDGDDRWLQGAAQALKRAAPSSLALVWALQARARHLSLAGVFRLELILALRCCAGPDFTEGVRALLVDKDQTPLWQELALDDAGAVDALLARHFAAPWPVHPLADLAEQG